MKEVVGKPILYAGTGEKLDDFEPFHPDRMASRILGMGDMLTLIEKAEAAFDEDQKAKAEQILQEGKFTLEDFLDQLQQVKKMGPLQNVLGMMPGMPKDLKNVDIDDKEIASATGTPVDPIRVSMRVLSLADERLEKDNTTTCDGDASPRSRIPATLLTRNSVLPVPGPATMI